MGKDMTIISKITTKGQTTIPAQIREGLGVGPGDRLEFEILPDGRVTIRKARHGLEALRGIIKLDFPVTGEDIDRWCREVRGGGWGRE